MKKSIKKTVKKSVTLVEPKKAVKEANERYTNFTERALKANNSKRGKLFNTLKGLISKLTLTPKEYSIKTLIGSEYVAKGLARKIKNDFEKDGLAFNYEELPFKAKKVISLKLSK